MTFSHPLARAAVLAAVFLAAPAAMAGTMISNHSGLPIDELSVAKPGTKAWGPNLMEKISEGSLDSGKSVELGGLKDGVYDFRISAPDEGVLCYMANVKVKGGKVDLTPEMGKACK